MPYFRALVDLLVCAVAVLVDVADIDIEIEARAITKATIPFTTMDPALVPTAATTVAVNLSFPALEQISYHCQSP